MKRISCLLLLAILSTQANLSSALSGFEGASPKQQTSDAALTNSDVLQMLQTGLSSDVVIAKIKTGVCSFDTSPAALKELKTERVPDDVILALVQARVASLAESPPSPNRSVSPDSLQNTRAESERSDDATVYIYRPSHFAGSAVKYQIYIDDVKILALGNGRYSVIKVHPGRHSFALGGSGIKRVPIEFDIGVGQEYFFRAEYEGGGFFTRANGILSLVTKEEGTKQIAKLKETGPSKENSPPSETTAEIVSANDKPLPQPFTGIYSLQALIDFDSLDGAIFDRATGTISLFGHRTNRDRLVRVAYLDHLATALESDSPTFSLEWTSASEREIDRALEITDKDLGEKLTVLFDQTGHLTSVGKWLLREGGVAAMRAWIGIKWSARCSEPPAGKRQAAQWNWRERRFKL